MPRVPTVPSASQSKREARAKAKARADRAHERYVQKTYGLQPGEYQTLLDAQDGRCAICTRVPRNRRLAVDHSHFTGRVRALLCYTCNHFVLRYVEGDPIAAHNAAVYIAAIAAEYGDVYEPRLSQALPVEAPRQPVVSLPWLNPESTPTSGRSFRIPKIEPRSS